MAAKVLSAAVVFDCASEKNARLFKNSAQPFANRKSVQEGRP
jgi:hypothetical protein